MRGWLPLVAMVALVACASAGAVPRDPPPDDAVGMVRDAEALARAGQYQGATRLLDEIARRPPTTPSHDRALFGLGRLFVLVDNPARDYRLALASFDRLLAEHPRSPYAADARAWREVLTAQLALSQELEARTQELKARTQDLQRLRRLDLELERARRP